MAEKTIFRRKRGSFSPYGKRSISNIKNRKEILKAFYQNLQKFTPCFNNAGCKHS